MAEVVAPESHRREHERSSPLLPSDKSRSDLVASASTSASVADQHPNTTTAIMANTAASQQHPSTEPLATLTSSSSRPPSPSANPSPRPETHREASMASSSHKMAISDDERERERDREGPVAGSSTDPHRDDHDADAQADETVQPPPRSRVRLRSERANVLDEAAKRRHRRRPSTDSAESSRSRTPSPILGRASTTALVTRSDIQAILYNSSGQSAYGGVESAKPQTFADSSEINAVIASVEGMDLRDQGSGTDLAAMVRKLGQHALEQDTYIRLMEESMHNTRVTAVSVISNLTASHAYELAQERQLRDRLEVELEGAQASARMLSSLLNKSQSKSREMDRQRAASVEEEMKWAASLPGPGPRKPSATAIAGANAASAGAGAATSPRPPPPTTPPKSLGLGITDTSATTPSNSSHHPQDVFDSPMSAVIAERNKLAADKRYLRNRVRDAEAQLHRLENELKALRPLLVQGTGGSGSGAGAKAMLSSAPSTPHRNRDQVVPMTGGSSATTPGNRSSKKASSGSSRRRRPTTLGDAEAEHLLLAARRLNNVRAQQQAAMETTSTGGSPVARPRTPPPRLGPGIPPKTPSSTATLTARTPRTIKNAGGGGSPVKLTSRNGKASLDPMLPSPAPGGEGVAAHLMGSPQAKARALAREQRGDGSTFEPRHERVDSTASHISHTSQASHAGMDELLHAAQSVLTPRDRAAAAQQPAAAPNNYFPPAAALPKTHDVAQRPPSYFESPKRRRVSMSAGDADWAAQQRIMSASPQQRYANPLHHKSSFPLLSSSPRRGRTRTEGAERAGNSDVDDPPHSSGLSALDLLADQAAASQNPSQSSEPSSSDNERRDDDRRHAGFSSQEEGGDDDGGPPRGISGLPPPRSAASSLMAARSRVNASGPAPIAYAHSVAPHSDYGSPRYAGGPPPLPPTGHGGGAGGGMIGSPVSHGSSPLLNNDGYALPPIHTGLPPPHHHGMHSGGGHYSAGLPPPPPPPPGMPLHPHHHHHHMPYAHHGHYSPHGGMNGGGSASSPNIPLPPTPTSAYLSPNSADANGFAPLPGHRSSNSYDGGVGLPKPPSGSTSSSTSASAAAAASSSSSTKPKGGNTSPDKRLPYVRWTSEEDEKLKRAIAQYGQRWEAVAKAVGTRSYHQCRQRALLMRRKGVDPAAAGRAGSAQGSGGSGGGGQRVSGSASAASGSPADEGDGAEDEGV